MTEYLDHAQKGDLNPYRQIAAEFYSPSHPVSAVKFTIVVIMYKFGLDISYGYLAEIYEYQGLFYSNRSFLSTALSWIILLCSIPFIWRVFKSKSFSGNVMSILTIFSVIPTMSAIAYRQDYKISYILLQILYWSLFFIAWMLIKKISIPSFNRFRSTRFHNIVLVILLLSVIFYSYVNTGLRLHLSLIDVYDLRAEARGFEAPFPLNYLISLADNLLAFFAVYALYRKKYALFFLVMFVIYLNFSITGTKQVIFVALLGIMGYFFIKDFSRSLRLLYAATVLVALSMVESWLTGGNVLNTIFAYRVLFIPTELHYSYYQYFQIHDIMYFSQSILKWVSSIESENVQFLLGEYAIGDYTARANNGLFSDSYMNLGVVGVVIYPVVIATFLRILDGAVEGLPQRILFVVAIYVGFVLLGMTFTAALLTSGLIFLVLLMYSLPRDGGDYAME